MQRFMSYCVHKEKKLRDDADSKKRKTVLQASFSLSFLVHRNIR